MMFDRIQEAAALTFIQFKILLNKVGIADAINFDIVVKTGKNQLFYWAMKL
ncbi:hypothetical protein [Rickettsia oklahomensis]|uniref:Uncharacterized protein n=1 Tax=Rickettsia oklahomensis TaxID=3141789 RepID=A0AAU7BX33_9RICK